MSAPRLMRGGLMWKGGRARRIGASARGGIFFTRSTIRIEITAGKPAG
jgi:hypothetical protein